MSRSKRALSAPARNEAYLAFGSNLGEREGHLRAALAELRLRAGAEIFAVSSLYATEPVGLAGPAPRFLNAVAGLRTALSPEALLDACLAIEAAHGRLRPSNGRPASRTLDIDLLDYAGTVRSTPRLVLPHPRLTERAFVLLPLAEIAPNLRISGKTAAEWASRADAAGVTRLSRRSTAAW
ncbi:MAG: 2-amino-4-hydroxy-6-hydroxymethyldihydropteridine diphosphokinase [Opitutaceae bacterium]